jgi:hypothetical protein
MVNINEKINQNLNLNILLSNNQVINFKKYIHNIYELQYNIPKICREYKFTPILCGEFNSKIQNIVYLNKLIRDNNLPSIQYLPKRERPFVFLHIEKTAGTTLRFIFKYNYIDIINIL